MKFFLIVLLSTVAVSSSAFAKCYSMKQAEAEQGIRIHSELMVIALNCQHLGSKKEENLYTRYRKFTSKHASIFAGYETTLIDFFRSEGKSDPVMELNTLRTDFANKISKDAATMRPDGFCKVYAPRIAKAAKMNDADLHKWASTIFPSHPVSRSLCTK